jgi:hypothetical protein
MRDPAGFGLADAGLGSLVAEKAVTEVEVVEEGAVMVLPFLQAGEACCCAAAVPIDPRDARTPKERDHRQRL